MAEYHEFDDEESHAEALDAVQDSLYAPAKWSWALWLSHQCSNVGDIVDTVGKMFHDTTISLRQHYNYRQQVAAERAIQQKFADEALAEIEELTGG